MSKSFISPYPRVLPDQMVGVLGASVVYQFISNDQELAVEALQDGHCRLITPAWRPRFDPIIVRATITIKHPSYLFSPPADSGMSAVANIRAQIGLALKWALPETKIRGVKVCDEKLTSDTEDGFVCVIEYPFEPSRIRNRAEFSVELYLDERESDSDDVFARIRGSGLGVIGVMVLHTGGSGGMFPTCARKNGAANPLWELELHIDDEIDLQRDFSGDVCMLYLNSDHKLFSEVTWADLSGAVSPLMFEIFSECCVMLIVRAARVLEDSNNKDALDGEAEEEDDGMSTLSALRYLKRCLFPEIPSAQLFDEEIENLSRIARMSLGRRLKQLDSADGETVEGEALQ